MGNLALTAQGLSKQYRVGGSTASYRTLRESLAGLVRRAPKRQQELFWAVRDVSFAVNHGEVVGIIGRNGAGKSTLLKLLSRITTPTRGEALVYGRLASLLEVGTGFHPELSGRENIYLNGSILGMSRAEVRRRFDEIVQFAEVPRFIDTPVKHYSSGMYLRLAFSVAAHLEPEILVVDEVLAVGDASFQRKCLNKMEDVSKGGRTVLFVSHNMPAVTRLCPRTILLDSGVVVEDGPSHRVVGTYLRSGAGTTSTRTWVGQQRPGNEVVRLERVEIVQDGQVPAGGTGIGRPIGLVMEYEVLQAGCRLTPNFHVLNEEGTLVFSASDTNQKRRTESKATGRYRSVAWIPGNLLAEGTFVVSAAVSTMDPVIVHFFERDAVAFQVIDPADGTTARGEFAGPFPGVVRPLLQWDCERLGHQNGTNNSHSSTDRTQANMQSQNQRNLKEP